MLVFRHNGSGATYPRCMTDVLLARGGFVDDTALLRVHHDAGLEVRTVGASVAELSAADIAPEARSGAAVVVFSVRLVDGQVPGHVAENLAELSAAFPNVGFLAVLESVDAGAARVRASVTLYEAGADDVFSLRLDPVELSARVCACVRKVRRRGRIPAPVVRPGAGRQTDSSPSRPMVDPDRRELRGSAGTVALTGKELIILSTLVSSGGVVRREHLGDLLWTGQWSGTRKAIDMHVANLRRKLPQACAQEWRIETVRGEGFVLKQRPPAISDAPEEPVGQPV